MQRILGIGTVVGLSLLFIGAVITGVYAVNFSMSVSRESYAQWGVARMINEHMRENESAWPRSWDDLAPYEQYAMGSLAFEELPAVVGIDSEADPKLLAQTPESTRADSPFRVVWLRNGRKVHYEGQEPNQMIWEHLVRGVEHSSE